MSNVLLFGDQTADQRALLHKVALRSSNPLVSSFNERISVVLRDEIKALPRTLREQVPDFLTINNLVELYFERQLKIPVIESVLVTIVQLGHFIGYFSEHPEELPTNANTRTLGLCTGLLAASAAVSAKNIADLLPLAVETVRVSFKAGLAVQEARDALILPGEEKSSWSTIVTGTNEQAAKEALAAFHAENGVPQPSQAYISAISVMALTISGPPSTLKRFFAESALSKNNRVPISVFAPYHASHLFGEQAIDKIVAGSETILKAYRPASLVHSAATGKPIVADNTYELIRAALAEMLQYPVRWDHLLEETVSQMSANTKIPAKIFSIGVSNVAGSLVSALKAGGHTDVSVVDQAAWSEDEVAANGRTQNDKIAIVGMAGRFPNAASHEALWDLLMKGLDVHRRIPAIVSMQMLTAIQVEKERTSLTLHSVASSMSQVFSIHVSSTCLHVKLLKPIQWVVLHLSLLTKLLRCLVTFQTELHPPSFTVSVLSTVKLLMTGVKSTQLRMSILTSSLVVCVLSHQEESTTTSSSVDHPTPSTLLALPPWLQSNLLAHPCGQETVTQHVLVA
ncbi:hypothetical protein MRB53_038544 [Persea americana]|nr:hypothetical protein MRB53_038544 [Persea americana]